MSGSLRGLVCSSSLIGNTECGPALMPVLNGRTPVTRVATVSRRTDLPGIRSNLGQFMLFIWVWKEIGTTAEREREREKEVVSLACVRDFRW